MKEKILNFISDNPYCKIGDLCSQYDGKKKDLMELLKTLEVEGDIINEDDSFILPSTLGLLKATIVSVKKHCAFALIDNEEDDIRIEEEYMGNAFLGDIVYLRYMNGLFKVIQVIKRRYNDIVGEVIKDEQNLLLDVNALACENIKFVIKEGSASVSDIVQAQILSFDKTICFVKITNILGQKNAPFMDIKRVILENDAPIEFPDEVNQEVLEIPQSVSESDLINRSDFRNEFIVTIDGDDSRDFDDAISLTKENGIYTLGVHIADVSYYVKEGSALDKEAFNRGTSIYSTSKVVPMLPFSLSNGICSLNEGVDRLTLSCIIQLDEYGNILNSSIEESVIRSSHRLTYNYVNEVLETKKGVDLESLTELEKQILLFDELAHIIRKTKIERGCLELDVPEIKITVDEKGFPIDVSKKVSRDAEKLIEDFMVLANEVVAKSVNKINMPFVYRIHENPVAKKLSNFISFSSRVGIKADFSPLSCTPLDLQKHINKMEPGEKKNVICATLLRCLAKARYATTNKGHFGLASKCYTHFTSPIRRYPDLVVHRLLKRYIINKDFSDLSNLSNLLDYISENTSVKERRAITIERECNDIKGAEYMEQFIGQTFTGYIDGITNNGLYFELENGLSGSLRFEDMDDYYIVNEAAFYAVGRRTNKKFFLGDKITATLIKCDKYAGTSTFALINDKKPRHQHLSKKKYKKRKK
ncbi:MAG: ribonuclease R [Bacilli bacterium]